MSVKGGGSIGSSTLGGGMGGGKTGGMANPLFGVGNIKAPSLSLGLGSGQSPMNMAQPSLQSGSPLLQNQFQNHPGINWLQSLQGLFGNPNMFGGGPAMMGGGFGNGNPFLTGGQQMPFDLGQFGFLGGGASQQTPFFTQMM